MVKIFTMHILKSNLRLFIVIIATIIAWDCGNIQKTQAQSFQRVYKNGVIYYYFSTREDDWSKQHHWGPGGNKIIRSPVVRKTSPLEVDRVVVEASRHYNLPPNLIKAVIRVESNFVDTATSPKGAKGLMQLMPATAEELEVRNPYDIRENIWAGTRYLSILLDKFGYRLPLALAAYNAGPQRVEQCRGIPTIDETQKFVRKVCTSFLEYSQM